MQSVPTQRVERERSPARWFPGVDAVEASAALFPALLTRRSSVELADGRLWNDGRYVLPAHELRHSIAHRLVISPGVLQLATNRAPADPDRVLREDQADVDEAADQRIGLDDHGFIPEPINAGTVQGFSARSRARMLRTIAELDWPTLAGMPTMVTLTYPGDWRAVCPDGRTAKRHFRAFLERWRRAWGDPQGVWKLEFQRRGAPHFHLYAGRPEWVEVERFREWVAVAWAAVVKADGFIPWSKHLEPAAVIRSAQPGTEFARHLAAGSGVDDQRDGWVSSRAVDIRRLATYFAKHNAKGAGHYQHQVPDDFDGVGRFWGVLGLDRCSREVEVNTADFVHLRRLLTKAREARFRGRSVPVVHDVLGDRVDFFTGERLRERQVRWEPERRYRARRSGRLNGTWTLVEDGPALAAALARSLEDRPPWPKGQPRPLP